MTRIGVDVDGVGYSFTEDARIVVADYLHIHPTELDNPAVWDFMIEQWGVDSETFWRIWGEDVARGTAWQRFGPEPGYVEGITKLRDAGHQVVIVTNRKGGELATMQWIQTHRVPYDGLFIGRDKTLANIDVLVDDWEGNWTEACGIGRRCLVWNQPWNSHIEVCERVHSWDDVIKAVSE